MKAINRHIRIDKLNSKIIIIIELISDKEKKKLEHLTNNCNCKNGYLCNVRYNRLVKDIRDWNIYKNKKIKNIIRLNNPIIKCKLNM